MLAIRNWQDKPAATKFSAARKGIMNYEGRIMKGICRAQLVRTYAGLGIRELGTRERVALAVHQGVASLRKFPQRGRTGRKLETRELVFPDLPLLAVYRIRKDVIEIIRILHSAQDWQYCGLAPKFLHGAQRVLLVSWHSSLFPPSPTRLPHHRPS